MGISIDANDTDFSFKTKFIFSSLIDNILFEPVSPGVNDKFDYDFKTVANILFPGYDIHSKTTIGSFEIVSEIKFEINGKLVYSDVIRASID